ncbi:MAG: bacterial transcriptional activator domain-containing protein [Oscillospiraceae bacterium]|nr:bacterial transcriptional activator domain-containing protein [Oscillospiraceae bacterium]
MRINVFGRFDVRVEGKSILSGTGEQTVGMLRFLMARRLSPDIGEDEYKESPEPAGPKGRRPAKGLRARLMELFAYNNSFKRDFSGLVEVPYEAGSHIWLSEDVEVDAEELDGLCASADSEKDPYRLADLMGGLLEVYAGWFMESNGEAWVLKLRERYHARFIAASAVILTRLRDLGRHSEVCAYCERIFRLDELDESINALYVNALIECGKLTFARERCAFLEDRLAHMGGLPQRVRELMDGIKSVGVGDAAAVEGFGEGDGPALNKRMIKSLIVDAVKEYMVSEGTKYSIAIIKVDLIGEAAEGDCHREMEDVKKNLAVSLEYVLRRNDMYVIHEDGLAVAVLSDARPDFFSNICGRIKNTFLSGVGGEGRHSMKIDILPATKLG